MQQGSARQRDQEQQIRRQKEAEGGKLTELGQRQQGEGKAERWQDDISKRHSQPARWEGAVELEKGKRVGRGQRWG